MDYVQAAQNAKLYDERHAGRKDHQKAVEAVADGVQRNLPTKCTKK